MKVRLIKICFSVYIAFITFDILFTHADQLILNDVPKVYMNDSRIFENLAQPLTSSLGYTYDFDKYRYEFLGSPITTSGGGLWGDVFTMYAWINNDKTVIIKVEKRDGSLFSSQGFMFLQKESYGPSASYNLASGYVTIGNTYIYLRSEDSLDNINTNWDNNQLEIYARYENTGGGYAWVGPCTIKRIEQTASITLYVWPSDLKESRWRASYTNGTTLWFESGKTISGIKPGDAEILFKSIPGWKEPNTMIVQVEAGKTYQFTVNYTRLLPEAPISISATEKTYADRIRITWDSTFNTDTYELWRSLTLSESTAELLTICTDDAFYNDTDVMPNQMYYYWVKSSNSAGTSPFSLPASGSIKDDSVIIDTVALAPENVQLLSEDDSGVSHSDGLTKKTTELTITGFGEEGATVELFDDDFIIPDATGIVVNSEFFINITLVENNAYIIKARQTDLSGNISDFSEPLLLTIDTIIPEFKALYPQNNDIIYPDSMPSFFTLELEESVYSKLQIWTEIISEHEMIKYYWNHYNDQWVKNVENENYIWISDKDYLFRNVDWTDGDYYYIKFQAIDEAGNQNETLIKFGYGVKNNSIISYQVSNKNFYIGERLYISGSIKPVPEKIGKVNIIRKLRDRSVYIGHDDYNKDGSFDIELNCDLINESGIWTLAVAWDGDEKLEEAESQTITFTVLKAAIGINMNPLSSLIEVGDTIDLSGKIFPPTNCSGVLPQFPIIISALSHHQSFTYNGEVKTNNYGFFAKQIAFDKIGKWEITVDISDNQSFYSRNKTTRHISVVEGKGYAIIIKGKSITGEGETAHNKTTYHAYHRFHSNKFPVDNILYLNYDTHEPGVDALSSKSAVEKSIKDWAYGEIQKKIGSLYVVLVGHGGENTFQMNGEVILDYELNNWLTFLQDKFSDLKIVIVLGFCHSGSFIDKLSGPGRIVIASADADEFSFKGFLDTDGIKDGDFFVSEFFRGLKGNNSIFKSFEEAALKTQAFTFDDSINKSLQHPLIIDPDELSHEFFIGEENQVDTFNIQEVSPSIFLNDNGSTKEIIWAKLSGVGENSNLTLWIEIKPPDYCFQADSTEITLTKVFYDSYNDEKNQYEWNVGQYFDSPGTYQIFYYAKKLDPPEIASMKISKIYRPKAGNLPPYQFSLITPDNNSIVPPTLYDKKEGYLLFLDWVTTIAYTKNNQLTYSISMFTDDKLVLKEGIESSETYINLPFEWVEQDRNIQWYVQAIDEYGAKYETDIWTFDLKNANPITDILSIQIFDESNNLIKFAFVYINDEEVPHKPGYYYITNVIANTTYNLSIIAPGYKTANSTFDITEVTSKRRRLDIKLETDTIIEKNDTLLAIQIVDDSKQLIVDASVFINENIIETNPDKWHYQKVQKDKNYNIQVKAPGYLDESISYSVSEILSEKIQLIITLEPVDNCKDFHTFTIDIDDNCKADPLTDGILIMRHLFGYSGDALLINAVDTANGKRIKPKCIDEYLSYGKPYLDIDKDGNSDALTDGLMIIRYLFGLTDKKMIKNAMNCTSLIDCPSLEDIVYSIEKLLPSDNCNY